MLREIFIKSETLFRVVSLFFSFNTETHHIVSGSAAALIKYPVGTLAFIWMDVADDQDEQLVDCSNSKDLQFVFDPPFPFVIRIPLHMRYRQSRDKRWPLLILWEKEIGKR